MMPNNALSTPTVRADWLEPDSWERSDPYDWERGGVAINDSSQGINTYNWKGWKDLDGNIWVNRVEAPDADKTFMFYEPEARRVGLAFDRNMNPAICYEKGSNSYLYWYDSSIPGYTTSFLEGAYSPAITHDDKRDDQSTISDILLFYVRENKVYMRRQRDRYDTEFYLRDLPAGYRLERVGMGRNLRLQFWFTAPE